LRLEEERSRGKGPDKGGDAFATANWIFETGPLKHGKKRRLWQDVHGANAPDLYNREIVKQSPKANGRKKKSALIGGILYRTRGERSM